LLIIGNILRQINDVTHPISPRLTCAAQSETFPHTITVYGGGLVNVQGLDCPWGNIYFDILRTMKWPNSSKCLQYLGKKDI